MKGAGEIEILVRKTLFETEGAGAEGVHGLHRSSGDIHIGAQNTEVISTGAGASGVRGSHGGTGAIELDLKDVTITTQGRNADGVFGFHVGEEGAVRIHIQGGEITTMGQDAEAIRGTLEGVGDIDIDVQGTEITTRGNQAEAIIAIHLRRGRYRNERARGIHRYGGPRSRGRSTDFINATAKATSISTRETPKSRLRERELTESEAPMAARALSRSI